MKYTVQNHRSTDLISVTIGSKSLVELQVDSSRSFHDKNKKSLI